MASREEDPLGLNDDPDLIVDPIERQAVQDELAVENAARRAKIEEVLRARKNAYSRMFVDGGASKDDISIVLDDLHRFCRWRSSTFHADPRLHAAAEGRREVALRIHDYCELSMEALFNKLA